MLVMYEYIVNHDRFGSWNPPLHYGHCSCSRKQRWPWWG